MDWLQNIPDFLKMSWAEISKVMIGVFMAAGLAYGWVRAVREKERIIRQDRDRLQSEIAKFEAQLREQRETQDRLLREQRAELDARNLTNLKEAGQFADHRVAAERAAAQKELDQFQRAAEREKELLRLAAEREAEQFQKQADLKERHLAQAKDKEIEHIQRDALLQVENARKEAVTLVQKAKADASQALEQAQKSFTAKLSETIQRHVAETEQLQAIIADQARLVKETETSRAAAEQKIDAAKASQSARLDMIHRIWEAPPVAEPPVFMPIAERKTRFIAVANLKGGVGKTTIAGNMGMSLACRGQRVLLVDLDFQGSLTQVALERKGLTAAVKRRETARALFDSQSEPATEWLDRIIHRVEGIPADAKGTCDIIGAWNDLADVELREMAGWILDPERDIRFRIRELFHQPAFCERYDYVIFDCPPRLTTGAVNALAASDGVVIPIMLDWQSAAPILYMLRKLKELRPAIGSGRVMGMVANQVRYNAGKPIQRMQSIFDQVCKRLDAEQLTAADAFRVMVKMEPDIGAEVDAGRIAAAKPSLRPLFKELVDSLERVIRHESLTLV